MASKSMVWKTTPVPLEHSHPHVWWVNSTSNCSFTRWCGEYLENVCLCFFSSSHTYSCLIYIWYYIYIYISYMSYVYVIYHIYIYMSYICIIYIIYVIYIICIIYIVYIIYIIYIIYILYIYIRVENTYQLYIHFGSVVFFMGIHNYT